MRNPLFEVILMASAAALVASLPAQSQTAQQAELQQLQSSDWSVRAKGFAALSQHMSAQNAPANSAALLQLLAREDAVVVKTLADSHGELGIADKYGEDFAEYYDAVFEACVQHCPKEPLLQLMLHDAQPGSRVQSDALSRLADTRERGFSVAQEQRIDSVLVACATDSRSFVVRATAITELTNVAHRNHAIPATTRAAMHRAIAAAVSDGNPSVRSSALTGLAEVGDSSDVPMLRDIAAHDTTRSINRGKINYPRRDEAQRALQRIAAEPKSAGRP